MYISVTLRRRMDDRRRTGWMDGWMDGWMIEIDINPRPPVCRRRVASRVNTKRIPRPSRTTHARTDDPNDRSIDRSIDRQTDTAAVCRPSPSLVARRSCANERSQPDSWFGFRQRRQRRRHDDSRGLTTLDFSTRDDDDDDDSRLCK
jgi:hypothetical protein